MSASEGASKIQGHVVTRGHARLEPRVLDRSLGRIRGMSESQPIDYEAARKRFPWIGLGAHEAADLSGRYREIMAQARTDREAMEAIDSIRRSA